MIYKLLVFIFDWKKKLDMNALYQKCKDPWGLLARSKQIEDAIGLVRGRVYENCLDVGCGLGGLVQAASGFCNNCVAIDISQTAIERTQSHLAEYKNIRFLCKNIRTWDPERKFDLILLGDVLYYLGDNLIFQEFKKTVGRIGDMLTDNGRILITHYIAPWRNETHFQTKYVNTFKEFGVIVEKESRFTEGTKTWFHVLLKKE